MITIRSLFFEINIDQNKEYVIYHNSYTADLFGRPLEEISNEEHQFDCGDIIIETENKRYTIYAVIEAYEWVFEILNYIDSKRDEENIFINLNELPVCGLDRSFEDRRLNNKFAVDIL